MIDRDNINSYFSVGDLNRASREFIRIIEAKYFKRSSTKERIDFCEFFLNSVEKFNNNNPGISQLRAKAYAHRIIGDFQNAKDTYEKIIAKKKSFDRDQQSEYAKFLDSIGEHRNAAEIFQRLTETGFVWYFIYAAESWAKSFEFEKALEWHQKSLNAIPKNYPWAHFAYAKFLEARSNYPNALEQYKLALNDEGEKGFLKRIISEAIVRIENLSDYSKQLLSDTITKILDACKYEGKNVTHYTGISALKSLIFDKSEFRLSEATYLNDPSEGNVISRQLIQSAYEQHVILDFENVRGIPTRPFVGSFVDSDFSDKLTLWRMYGREQNNEASGCSITIDRKQMLTNVIEAISKNIIESSCKSEYENNENESIIESIKVDLEFYHVVYLIEHSKSVIFKGETVSDEPINNHLSKLFDILEKNKIDEEYLVQQLNRIRYLFKEEEYSDEHEIRLLIPNNHVTPTVVWDSKFPRVYLNIGEIAQAINLITLGPKTVNSLEICTGLNYEFKNQGVAIAVDDSIRQYR